MRFRTERFILAQKRIQLVLDRHQTWLDLLVLAVLFWVARYWFSAQFGLYEDDFTRIPEAMIMSAVQFGELISVQMTELWTFRPLHDILIKLLARLGWEFGGLWGMYWVGYLSTLVNIALFYALLRRLGQRWFALIGAIAYSLFSADTTQAYLTLSLGLQHAITFLLLALHAYLSERRWLAYILAAPIILFAYETPYLVFAAAPLLVSKRWDRRWLQRAVFHLLIVAVIFLISYWSRNQAGLLIREDNLLEIIFRNTLNGPWMALKSYYTAARYAFRFWSYEMLIGMVLSFPLLLLLFWNMRSENVIQWRGSPSQKLPASLRNYLRLSLAGLAMLVAAYPLTLTTTVFETVGRETRAHSAAVVGAALLIASLVMVGLHFSRRFLWQKLFVISLVLSFTGLMGYGIRIQHEYRHAWELQQNFWRALVPLIPDAAPGNTILVDASGLEDTWQIGANTWNLPRILDQLYLFPDGQDPPRVFRLRAGQIDQLPDQDGLFHLTGTTVVAPPDFYGQTPSQSVIWIVTAEGQLIRQLNAITINGFEYRLYNEKMRILPNLTQGPLYPLLIEEP